MPQAAIIKDCSPKLEELPGQSSVAFAALKQGSFQQQWHVAAARENIVVRSQIFCMIQSKFHTSKCQVLTNINVGCSLKGVPHLRQLRDPAANTWRAPSKFSALISISAQACSPQPIFYSNRQRLLSTSQQTSQVFVILAAAVAITVRIVHGPCVVEPGTT